MPRPRPSVHLTAPVNWLNDPNGPCWWNGAYHLFFQYNPDAPRWGRPHWGHAVSPDLVHWTHRGIALTPSPEGADRDGCWSGCTRIIDGVPTIFYTGVVGHTDDDRIEAVCRAIAVDDDLAEWRKDPEPVIASPPPQRRVGFHRDPFVFWDNDRWRMLLGSSTPDTERQTGAVISYESDDLGSWRYAGEFFRALPDTSPVPLGQIWECPQLVRFDDADVLIISVQDPDHPSPLRHAVYFIGESRDGRFYARASGLVDHGEVFYAPAALDAPDGRHLLWGWIQESRTDPANVDFVGALSLPRVLELHDDRLVSYPVEELNELRVRTRTCDDVNVADDVWSIELESPTWELELTATHPLELTLHNPDGQPQLQIQLTPDGSLHAQNLTEAGREQQTPEIRLPSRETTGTTLRILADQDLIELFASGTSYTTRIQAPDGNQTLELEAISDVSASPPQLRLHTLATTRPVGTHRR